MWRNIYLHSTKKEKNNAVKRFIYGNISLLQIISSFIPLHNDRLSKTCNNVKHTDIYKLKVHYVVLWKISSFF